ncbi:MAG TPA: M23 family metallopeptidase [Bacilli bacterium]|nr:M23 family metallopeptidase [Bacilli bacterium]
MKKFRLTKTSKYLLCGVAMIGLISSLSLVNLSFDKGKENIDIDQEYVSKIVINDEIPVVNTESIIIKPYLDTNVKIVKNFYNYQGTDEEQQNSIIYYESTYMPNYAVAYGGAKNFEVISVLDGTVLSIKKDDLLGNVVEIKHDNELISVYQSLADITVKENQVVKQGDVIGKAGTSNINKDLNEHLLFEMLYKGQIVNPEEYYNKNISEL